MICKYQYISVLYIALDIMALYESGRITFKKYKN
jgi:hypothetical protein